MKNTLKSTKTTIICCIIIGILLIGLSVYMSLADVKLQTGKSGEPTLAPDKAVTPTEVILPTAGDTEAVVMVLEVKKEQKTVELYNPVSDERVTLRYDGTTDIRNRFHEVIAAAQVDAMSFAKVSYGTESGFLFSLEQTAADWHYDKQEQVTILSEKEVLTVKGNSYRLGKNVVVQENGKRIPLSELAPEDELSITGIGDRVCLIQRTKGHGTVRLMNTSVFDGEVLLVDGEEKGIVAEDMRLTLQEGEYRFLLKKGELLAEKTLLVKNGKVSPWDLSEYVPEEPEYGRVEFLLEPEGAELYIDGKDSSNTAYAELTYGEHVVGVYKDGFVGWNGKITVSSEEMLFSVSLVPELTPTPTQVPEATPVPTRAPEATPAPTQAPEIIPPSGDEEAEGQDTETEESAEKNVSGKGKTEVQIVWYPASVVSIDSVYAGTTDASGILTVSLEPGTHSFELVRVLLDGSTPPKRCTADVNEQSAVLNFLLED